MRWLVAAGLIGICLALVLLPRRTVDARALAVLRCFFPSWRFFEEIEPGPTLFYCVATRDEAFGPWQVAWVPSARGPAALLLNARGNLELAYQSLVEQFWNDLEEASGAPLSTSTGYQLVVALIQSAVLAPAERAPGTRFRFRLRADGSPDYESEVHEVEPAR